MFSNILFRHIILRSFKYLFLITLTLIGLVWLTQSLRFIELIVQYDLSLIDFFKTVIYLVPDLMGYIIPFSFSISIIYVYYKLHIDREIIILKAVGLSNLRVAFPILILSLVLSLFLGFVTFYLSPLSYKNFNDFRFKLSQTFRNIGLQKRSFTTFKNFTIYVHDKAENQELKGLFIHHKTKKSERIISAKSGYVYFDDSKDGLVLILKDGKQYITDLRKRRPKTTRSQFQSLRYDLSKLMDKRTQRRNKKIYEMETEALLFPSPTLPFKEQQRMRVEGHQRILFPLSLLCNALLISFFFCTTPTRRFKKRKVFVSFASIAALYVLMISALQNSLHLQNTPMIPFIYGGIMMLSLFLIVMIRKETDPFSG